MSGLLAVGGLAWDRVLRLSGPLESGARLTALGDGRASSDNPLPGRLGGGAANAAVAWANAGWQACVAGLVSTDREGDAILAALSAAGVESKGVVRSDLPTPMTLILVEPGGERTILGVRASEVRDYRSRAAALADMLPDLMETSGVDGVFLRAPIPLGRDLPDRVPVLAHWDGGDAIPSADIVVASSADIATGSVDQAFDKAKSLCGARMSWLVLTSGAERVEAMSPGRRISTPVASATPVDTTGAGDIFAAGLLEALAGGATMEEALRHAVIWGARAVEQSGSAPLAAQPGTFPRFRP